MRCISQIIAHSSVGLTAKRHQLSLEYDIVFDNYYSIAHFKALVKPFFQKNQNFFETCREVFSGADRVLHFMRGWGGIIITRKENSGRCLWPGRRSCSQHGAAIQAASRAKGQQGRTAGYQRTYPPLAAGRSRGVKAGTEPGGAWWRESIIAASHAARTDIGLEQRG